MAQLIRITSRQAGFRRRGVAHPAEPTVYAADHFSPGELARLQAEPMLVVEVIPDTTRERQGQAEGTAEGQATGADASAPATGAKSVAPVTQDAANAPDGRTSQDTDAVGTAATAEELAQSAGTDATQKGTAEGEPAADKPAQKRAKPKAD